MWLDSSATMCGSKPDVVGGSNPPPQRLAGEELKLKDRGCLAVGCFADIVVFDPQTITDHATYPEPMKSSSGVSDVFVNGAQVLRNGEHTYARPGRVVRGPAGTGETRSTSAPPAALSRPTNCAMCCWSNRTVAIRTR